MNKHETIEDYHYRLKMLAKASVKPHKEFTYISKGIAKKVVLKG